MSFLHRRLALAIAATAILVFVVALGIWLRNGISDQDETPQDVPRTPERQENVKLVPDSKPDKLQPSPISSKPTVQYPIEDGINHLVDMVKDQIREKPHPHPIVMMRITNPNNKRSKCDLHLEEDIFQLLRKFVNIRWAGLDRTGYKTAISIERIMDPEKSDTLLLSGKIITSDKITNLADVEIRLDDALRQMLAVSTSSLSFVNLMDQVNILLEQDRLVAAKTCLNRALELEPNDPFAQKVLQQVNSQIEKQTCSKIIVKPSFLVCVHDIVDGNVADTQMAHSFLQNGLIQREFSVKKAKVLQEIRQSDAAILAGTDKEAYLAMARKYRSEILVWGSCRASLRNDEQIEGQHIYTYDTVLTLEIIDSSNADIVDSNSWVYHARLSDRTAGFSKNQAIEKAVRKLLDSNSQDIFSIVIPKSDWYSRGKKYELSFRNATQDDREKILTWFQTIDGVNEIGKSDYLKNLLEFTIFYVGEPETLIDISKYVLGFDLEKESRSALTFVKREKGAK